MQAEVMLPQAATCR